MDDDFLTGAFWVTVIAGAVAYYFHNSYQNLWTQTIPACTAKGGELLGNCYPYVEKAANMQKYSGWAFWIGVVSGVCLIFAALGHFSKNHE